MESKDSYALEKICAEAQQKMARFDSAHNGLQLSPAT
jgi:hypothetical protein